MINLTENQIVALLSLESGIDGPLGVLVDDALRAKICKILGFKPVTIEEAQRQENWTHPISAHHAGPGRPDEPARDCYNGFQRSREFIIASVAKR